MSNKSLIRIKRILSLLLCLALLVSPVCAYAYPAAGDGGEASDAADDVLSSDDIPEEAAEYVFAEDTETDEAGADDAVTDTSDYVEGEVVVLFHTGEDNDAASDSRATGITPQRSVINGSRTKDPLSTLGFDVEQVWDLTLDEEEIKDEPESRNYSALGNLGVFSIDEITNFADETSADGGPDEESYEDPEAFDATDLRVALVKKDGESTEELVGMLEDLDMVVAACPNYLYEVDDTDLTKEDSQTVSGASLPDALSGDGINTEDPDAVSDNSTDTTDETEDPGTPDDVTVSRISFEAGDFPVDGTVPTYGSYGSALINDPLLSSQGYEMGPDTGIHLEKALVKEEELSGTPNMEDNVVAVIDTGVDYENPDLAPNMWTDTENIFGFGTNCHGVNTVHGTGDPKPYVRISSDDHGTHVAGCIAAATGNGIGVASPAGTGHTKIMAFNAFYESGSLPLSAAVNAYEYIIKAKKAGVNVVAVNNSWGNASGKGTYNVPFSYVTSQAGKAGILTFGSAGNNNSEVTEYYTKVNNENPYEVIVSAANQNNELGSFSSYSEYYSDLAAPGAGILSTVPRDTTFCYGPVISARAGVSQNVSVSTVDDWSAVSANITYTIQDINSSTTRNVTAKVIAADAVSMRKDRDGRPVFIINKEGFKTFVMGHYGTSYNESDLKTYLTKFRIKIDFGFENPMTDGSASDYVYCPDVEYLYGAGEGDPCMVVQATVVTLKTAGGASLMGSSPYANSDTGYHKVYSYSPSGRGEGSSFLNATLTLRCYEDTSRRSGGIKWNENGDTIVMRLGGFAFGKKADFAPYAYKSGTSMATPVASGMAAEVAYLYQTKSALELRGRVLGGTRPMTDRYYNYNGTSHRYTDMTATGGVGNFDDMLQDDISGYNANIWALTVEDGNLLRLHGYALESATVTIDGTASETVDSDDDHLDVNIPEGLADGKQHRFIVRDQESGRTYKAEYIIPKRKTLSVNRACSLPTEDEAGYATLTSTLAGLCYGSGYGDYLYLKQGPIDAPSDWIELDAPGWPLEKRKIGASSLSIRYEYAEGGIYAFCTDKSKLYSGRAALYMNYMDMTGDGGPSSWRWDGYRELVTFDNDRAATIRTAAWDGRIVVAAKFEDGSSYNTYVITLKPGGYDHTEEVLYRTSFYGFVYINDVGPCLYVKGSEGMALYGVKGDGSVEKVDGITPHTDQALLEIMAGTEGVHIGGGYLYGGFNKKGAGEMYFLDTVGGLIKLDGAGISASGGLTIGELASYDGEILCPALSHLDGVSENSIYRIPSEFFDPIGNPHYLLSDRFHIRVSAGEGGSADISYLGNTVSQDTLLSGMASDTLSINALPDNGWYFDSWTLMDSFSLPESTTELSGWDIPYPAEDPLEFEALFWKDRRNAYTVTFRYGEKTLEKGVLEGNTAPIDEVESREDFAAYLEDIAGEDRIFTGWTLDGATYDGSAPVGSDMTLVAKELAENSSSYSGSGRDAYMVLVSGNEYYMVKGQKYTFGTGKKGRWTTDDSTKLTIKSTTGAVTAKQSTLNGSNKNFVTIKNGADGTTYRICIYEPLLQDEAGNAVRGTKKMVVGDTMSLFLKDRSSKEDMEDVSWISSNPAVASVIGGRVYATGKGSSTISAYVKGKAYSLKLKVSDTRTYTSAQLNGALVTDIILNPLNKVTLKNNKQTGFNPKNAVWEDVVRHDGSTGSMEPTYNAKGNKTTGYQDGIVSITHKGVISAIGPGQVTIRGKDSDGTEKIINITVLQPNSDIVSRIYVRKGKTATIKIPLVKASKAEWSSENEASVKLVKKGKVKGISYGVSTVHCIYQGFDFYVRVYTEDPTLDTSDGRIQKTGTGQKYSMTVSSGNAYSLKIKGVASKDRISYKSNKPAVLFVDERGVLYARGRGTVTLTVKAGGVTMKITVKVE